MFSTRINVDKSLHPYCPEQDKGDTYGTNVLRIFEVYMESLFFLGMLPHQ